VEWDSGQGWHNGRVNGIQYFCTQDQLPSGSLVRPKKLSAGVSLLDGLSSRYKATLSQSEEGKEQTLLLLFIVDTGRDQVEDISVCTQREAAHAEDISVCIQREKAYAEDIYLCLHTKRKFTCRRHLCLHPKRKCTCRRHQTEEISVSTLCVQMQVFFLYEMHIFFFQKKKEEQKQQQEASPYMLWVWDVLVGDVR
jgi:hypothetical protein